MKKGYSHTSSNKEPSVKSTISELNNSLYLQAQGIKTMNIAPLNISSINSNMTSSTQSEFPQARNSATSSGQSSYSSYQQICNEIVKTFLEIRQQTTEEVMHNLLARSNVVSGTQNQNAALLLRKTLPIDVEEKRISMMEPMTLLGYIKQIFSLISQLKNEVERELSEKKDSECSDYEAMLQKLEAEVRQHIRVDNTFLNFN